MHPANPAYWSGRVLGEAAARRGGKGRPGCRRRLLLLLRTHRQGQVQRRDAQGDEGWRMRPGGGQRSPCPARELPPCQGLAGLELAQLLQLCFWSPSLRDASKPAAALRPGQERPRSFGGCADLTLGGGGAWSERSLFAGPSHNSNEFAGGSVPSETGYLQPLWPRWGKGTETPGPQKARDEAGGGGREGSIPSSPRSGDPNTSQAISVTEEASSQRGSTKSTSAGPNTHATLQCCCSRCQLSDLPSCCPALKRLGKQPL